MAGSSVGSIHFGSILKHSRRGPNPDLDGAFRTAKSQRAGAVIILPGPVLESYKKRLADLAAKNHLPAMYFNSEFVEAGGLMSYAPDIVDLYRGAATYVEKILKGRRPTHLLVEQPIKFEFVINLKAAKQIGLTIPPNVLARADRVIR
jgi:putative ABC transport system substrate-binding protein